MGRIIALTAALLAACGGDSRPAADDGTPIGMSDPSSGAEAEDTPAVEGSVELALRRPDGSFIDIGELRGREVLLFLFATFDAPSQMMLRPLEAFQRAHPEVVVLGVAAQPDARLLVDAYVHALSPPFPITYAPEEALPADPEVLGPIEAIPAVVLLDARGVVVSRRYGYLETADLEAMLSASR